MKAKLVITKHSSELTSYVIETMADRRVSLPSGHSRWWRRSPNTCCSKKILLLLVWQVLFMYPWSLLSDIPSPNETLLYISTFLAYFAAPLIGWLADARFGRYEVIRFGSITSFLVSIMYYFALFNGKELSTLGNVLLSIATITVSFGFTCYKAAMLPFLTDQIIGATSHELSAVVRWYYWVIYLGLGFSEIVAYFLKAYKLEYIYVISTLMFAVPLAAIIISDCLCQQWLDRTHKATNPIKLIIQVLNYTRKHSNPERRSAFTYIDEEQPSRMDYGKEKFGGPFTEEEVEDVKTVLRLLPLVICLNLGRSIVEVEPIYLLKYDKNIEVLNEAIISWGFPVLLIPLYQLLLYRCFRNRSQSMLWYIGAGLFMCILGYILLSASGVWGIIVSDDVHRYLSCTALGANFTKPPNYVEWYWKLGPCILYGIGKTITVVLLGELIIAQSPHKMKGLVIGIFLSVRGFVYLASEKFLQLMFTLCYDMVSLVTLVVLFVVFLVLSKRYILRERNREINIQAIVEEHYERYMDQEEEYMRQH